MPVDAWGKWSEGRVALGRLHGYTYWLPVPIPIPRTPLGPVMPGGDPWVDSEAEARAAAQDALKAVELPEWCLQVPTEAPSSSTDFEPSSISTGTTPEEDWL